MGIVYNNSIITDGLVLCLDAANRRSYPGTGTTWFDISGNGNHVTLYNGVSFDTTDKVLIGDGTNDYGRTNNTLNLSNLNALTIFSIWKVPTTSSQGLIYEHTPNWNAVNSYEGISYGGFGIACNSNGTITTANLNHAQLRGNVGYAGVDFAASTTKYQFYTVIPDFSKSGGLESEAYVNAGYITRSNSPSSGGSTYNSNNTATFCDDYFYLWSRGGTTAFSAASIGLIQIYNRALTQSQILQNYLATRGRFGL